MTDNHGINSDAPKPQDLPEAPEHAQKKGLDAHDVEEIGSMITSDPPSSNMGESREDED